MFSKPKVKILVCCHRPVQIIKSDILVPIHVGRSLSAEISKDGALTSQEYRWMVNNMIGDDTGDNISRLNRRYSELTAIYWAWKNLDKLGNPDYVGFCHYRRYFDFLEKVPAKRVHLGSIQEKFIPPLLRGAYENETSTIIDKISQSEIIHAPRLIDEKGRTVYEQFKEFEHPAIGLKYDVFKEIFDNIPKNAPSFISGAQAYAAFTQQYCYNCFVMKREHFISYCEFIFPLLFAAEKRINYQELNLNGQRILAYIAERLTGVFITQKKIEKVKISSAPLVQIENTEPDPCAHPAFGEKNIPLIFACDNKYAPCLAVCLQSIIDHASGDNNYDINILIEKISPVIQEKICGLQKPNISIRFWSVSPLLAHLDKKYFYLNNHFTLSAYYRFFIPRIFCNYEKVIYLDCDLIVLEDIAKLYQMPLNGACMGAVQDVSVYSDMYTDWFYKTGWKAYVKDVLQLKNPWNYFQSGVLVMDIKKLLRVKLEEKCLEALSRIKPRCVDQCILNHVLQGQVKQLPHAWNVEWHLPFFGCPEQRLPAELYIAWNTAYKNPAILHYSSRMKPWKYIDLPEAHYWWKYARQTSFYERILMGTIRWNVSRLIRLSVSHLRYLLLSKITWGKKHEHYINRTSKVYAELKQLRAIFKGDGN